MELAPPIAGREGCDGNARDKERVNNRNPLAQHQLLRAKGLSHRPTLHSLADVYAADATDGDAMGPIQEEVDGEFDQEPDHADDDPADDQAGDDDGQSPQENDDEELDLDQLSQVLTVTGRTLAGLTLGRKFTTKKPGTSSSAIAAAIAKRKQSSHCSACGGRGHWKDDDVCPVKGKQQSHAKGNERGPPSKPNSSSASSQKPQQVFPVVRHDRGHIEIHDTEDFGNAFVCKMVNSLSFHVHEVQAFSSVDFIRKMILDSACQRTCCGRQWYQANSGYLVENFKLRCKHIETSDLFQFEKGNPLKRIFAPTFQLG